MPTPTREELDEQAQAAGLNPDDYATKGELEDALAAINPPPADPDEDTSGRPPLAEVAEELAADRNVRQLPAREEA